MLVLLIYSHLSYILFLIHKRKKCTTGHTVIWTRNTVERRFWVWKQKFRCLLRGFTTKLENTKLYIVALAILHNIAVHRQDLLEDIEGDDGNVPVTQTINNSLRGNAARAAFINEIF